MTGPGRRPTSSILILATLLGLFTACTSLGGGCSGLAPLPPLPDGGVASFPEAQKTDNVADLRISQDGIDYLNQNWQGLLAGFAQDGGVLQPLPDGGAEIAITLGCKPVTQYGYMADDGHPANGNPDPTGACSNGYCGRGDQLCDLDPNDDGSNGHPNTYDEPLRVTASITDFKITTSQPDFVQGKISLAVDTGNLTVDALCATCTVRFKTSAKPPNDNTLKLGMTFSVDSQWNNRVDLQVTQVDGIGVCGDTADGGCIDPNDISITSGASNACSDFTCAAASVFTQYVASYLSPFIHDALISVVNDQFCEKCGFGLPGCPDPDVTTCQHELLGGICVTQTQDLDAGVEATCVPRMLGVEGRATLADFAASFGGLGIPQEAQMDLSLGLGSSAGVDTGVNLGIRGGVLAGAQSVCVPPLPTPRVPQVPVPDFDASAPPKDPDGTGYHVALALSQPFLNQALFQAQQSGALCLNLTTANVGVLNTGLLKTFLPSLGLLAIQDGMDAPMLVAVRPGAAPSLRIGGGTDPTADPLITLQMPRLSIDFYAEIDHRLARLFTLTADVALPISLAVDGCDTLEPTFGDLQKLVTNVQTSNSELIAEDPSLLGELIPLALGLAEPALASMIKPISLPPFGNFKLQVESIKGINPDPSDPGGFYHLAVYTKLRKAAESCLAPSPAFTAALRRSEIPSADQMKLSKRPLPIPTAVVGVAQEASGDVEYSTRVDHGMWSDFRPASPDGALHVRDGVFLVQGVHHIEIRARYASEPGSTSAPVSVGFPVAWDPPSVRLSVDPDSGEVRARAHDWIAQPSQLEWSYRFGHGDWSAYGPKRTLSRAEVTAKGGVEIRVKDPLGNVGHTALRTLVTAVHPLSSGSSEAVGCDAPGGAPETAWGLLVLVLAAWGLRRRDG